MSHMGQSRHVDRAAARHKNFVRAAVELGMTQGAVSRHIKSLEARLGTPLFHRGPRGVSLTEGGDLLADYVRRGFDELAAGFVLSVASTAIGPVLRARRLSWSNAVTSTGPGAKALRASSKIRDGNVNNTAEGLIRIRTAIGCASDACAKFPGSIWRMPMRPSLGAVIVV